MRSSVAFIPLLILIAGCSKKPAIDAPAPVVPQPTAPTNAAPPIADLGLFDRMGLEAQNKDKADPPSQKVLEALAKAGISVTQQQQHLGATYGATYCVGLTTAQHLTINLCEFANPASAVAGAAAEKKVFDMIANSAVHTVRSTTLTVTEVPVDQISADAHKKLIAAFEAL